MIFGTSLPTDGPGLSARIRFMLEPPPMGMMARMKTRTPMPPIQCVKLRQKIEQWLNASTSLNMLAPVVVNPETVSNKASVKEGISPVSINGRQPVRLMRSQLREVATQPSFR